MAVSVAAALKVDKLLFLTDVDGVRGQDNQVCSELSLDECRLLVDNGVATGGMRAKLDSAVEALEAGIAGGRDRAWRGAGDRGEVAGGQYNRHPIN